MIRGDIEKNNALSKMHTLIPHVQGIPTPHMSAYLRYTEGILGALRCQIRGNTWTSRLRAQVGLCVFRHLLQSLSDYYSIMHNVLISLESHNVIKHEYTLPGVVSVGTSCT